MALGDRTLRALGIGGAVLLWWVAVPESGPIIPTLGDVVDEMIALAKAGDLWRDARQSLIRVANGVALATVLGLALGGLGLVSRKASLLLAGVIEILRPIPPIAWVPVMIMWFGIGGAPAIAIVTLGAFFPIWLGTQQGFSEVRREHVWAARTFGASRRRLLFDIVVPSALPYLLHGLRLGLGLGWFCLVAAEMMGVQQGLGHAIQLFSLNLEMEKIFGYIFVIGVLGLTMTEAVRWIEKRVVRWHTLSVGGYG